MNREGAETYLRLLAESEMRGALMSARAPRSADAPAVTVPVKVTRVAWALTAVDALDLETAEDVLADVELALAARHRHDSGQAGTPGALGPYPVQWPFAGSGLTPRVSRGIRLRAAAGPPAPGAGLPSARPPGPGGGSPSAGPPAETEGGPDRYVPVGRMLLFHDEMVSGDLDLMSFSHTACGARFTASWRIRNLLGPSPPEWPLNQFMVKDDRGRRYSLNFQLVGPPESVCYLSLHPEPPRDIRWLDVTVPGEAAVRISLEREAPATPDGAGPQVSETGLSTGEHLLNQLAERLLATAPQDRWLRQAPGPLSNLATGLGETVAALEAAGALSPLSPVPGRLAALCAGLRVTGHGITAPPARELPEPWFSLLTHYLRRKPDTVPAHDGFAAVTAALPELDGIRLVLLGLHNADGGTWLHAHAAGRLPDVQYGPFGLDASFPLSVWIRDSGGRWHAAAPAGWFLDSGPWRAARPAGRSADGGERAVTLRLVPPLARSTPWIEVLAGGRSAEFRARLPLGWGGPP